MNVRITRAHIISTLAITMLILAPLAGARAADTKKSNEEFCIQTNLIRDYDQVDERTLVVRMSVGKSYRIDFAGACASFGGFSGSSSMGGFPKFCKTDSLSSTSLSSPGSPSAADTAVGGGSGQGAQQSCAIERMVPIEKADANALVKDARGLNFAREGKMDKAIPEFREAIKIAPAFPESHRYLGLVLEKQGKVDDAYAEYREACTAAVAAFQAAPDDQSYPARIKAIDALLSPRGHCANP